MKILLSLIVGLLAGAMLTATFLSLGNIKKGSRPHTAAMVTLKYQLGEAREAIEGGCTAGDGTRQLQVMRGMADDVEPLFLEQGFEPELFGRHAQQMRDRLDAALALPRDASCAQRKQALTAVHNSCDSCHRDFSRG
jgi:hypothetical protein